MTIKTTVLRHLDQYRDKTLREGCRIKDFMKGEAVIVGVKKYVDKNESDCYYQFYDKIPHPEIYLSPMGSWEILGAPATLSTLLIALGKHETISKMTIDHDAENLMIFSPDVTIPLDTPLTEIPEDNKLWGQLLDLFELKV